MSDDDAIEMLRQRTRARREQINSKLAAVGEATRPIRSPLKEKNDTPSTRGRSPSKATMSPSKMSPRKISTPVRTGTFKVQKKTEETPSTSTNYSRVYEEKDGSSRSEETYNKEASEKKTTIIDGEPENGNYTKTTITEREETIEKREFLQFTEKSGNTGKARSKSPTKILEEYRAKREKEMEKVPTSPKSVRIDLITEKSDKSKEMGSPSRFGSCRDTSAIEEVFTSPARRSRLDLSLSPSKSKTSLYKYAIVENDSEVGKKNEPFEAEQIKDTIETKNNEIQNEEEEEDDGSYRSAQKRRLKSLASKFNTYDEEDSDSMKQILAQASATGSPYKRDLTKTVDVDKVINRSSNYTAPSTKNESSDLVKSLKAQGYEESSSKSKLVYDFKKKTDSRDSSPFKSDPMQFIRPQQNQIENIVKKKIGTNATTANSASSKRTSPVKTTKVSAYRSVSPTRMASPQQRPTSPFKPHPLQFVSPQKAQQAVHEPPAKPPRTYIDMEEENNDEAMDNVDNELTFKTEVGIEIAQTPNAVTREDGERSDTASRRSILEKRNLFESTSPQSDIPDPAMLPLSQRKALFEKNKSIPKPIARFGESVTPAMLSKANTGKVIAPASEPAWKRRRDQSPPKQSGFFTPASSRSESKTSEVQPNKKNLFQKDWQSNDIAKAQEEAKRKDMELLMNRFKTVSDTDQQKSQEVENRKSPVNRKTPSPKPQSPVHKPRTPTRKSPTKPHSPEEKYYPGVHSLKYIKVSPPRPGNVYPDLTENFDERPDTALSEESIAPSLAPSEAPSLGTAIQKLSKSRSPAMTAITENLDKDSMDVDMNCSGTDDEINDMLDEALDDSQVTAESGPTPPKVVRSTSPGSSSAASWEFQTPVEPTLRHRNFKTPRVDGVTDSPKAALPQVEVEEGDESLLMRSVSHYRKQKPVVKIVRNVEFVENEPLGDDEFIKSDDQIRAEVTEKINKLKEEVDEQMQRRAQASKALAICESKNEFEGSYERVEFERLLIEATHKYKYASDEITRLKNMMARGQFDAFKGRSESKGTISLSGIQLPLKSEFVKMLLNPGHGGDDYVHYFVCLVMYRSQVIATQMLSTLDGINRSGRLEFPNLIKINELDSDFKIYLQVYGLQTPKEKFSHNDKYNIKRQEKSVFNLVTPKKNKSNKSVSTNLVNNLNIRQSKFGMVGYTTITIDTLKNKTYTLEKVPSRSPLEGSLNMRLSVHSESNVTEKGFITYFTEVNGYGDWHRRWCVLKDNTLFFWKYPEDEQKRKAPIEAESISLHDCISDNVTLAPRDICARMNTFMLENRRSYQAGDKEALNMLVDKKHGLTTIRNLLMADTRDERLNWCKVLNTALENLRAWDPTSMRPRSSSVSASETSEAASDSVSNASTDIW